METFSPNSSYFKQHVSDIPVWSEYMSSIYGPFQSIWVRKNIVSSLASKILIKGLRDKFPLTLHTQPSRNDLVVDFSHAEVGGPDSFSIEISGDGPGCRASISAFSSIAFVYGVGKFLRSVTITEKGVLLPRTSIKLSPTHQCRGHEVSTSRYRGVWSEDDWGKYIEHLILMGCNWIWSASMVASPLEGCSERTEREWEEHLRVQNLQAELANSYGAKFGIHSYANNISSELVSPQIDKGGGKFVCPSTKRGRRLINDSREMLFRNLNRVDAVFTASHDPGGCPCGNCTPWVETYIPIMREQSEILSEYHPKANFYISNQGLSKSENRWLFEYLKSDTPSWLDGVVWGPQARLLEELRRGLPRRYDVLAFPDITHLIICQYPVRGFDQSNALIHYRESPTYRPCTMQRIFRETKRATVGSKPYSEGLHDDLNKAVWSGLHWGQDPEKTVEEYCRWHFGAEAGKILARAIFKLEENWSRVLDQNPEISRVLEKIRSVRGIVRPEWDLNWRYLILLFRAVCDDYIRKRSRRQSNLQSRVENVLADRKSPHRSRIERGLEILAREEISGPELRLKHELESYAGMLESRFGIDLTTVDRLDSDLASINWIRSLLERASSLNSESSRGRVIDNILSYEETQDGYYDDCGNPSKEPHLIRGEDYFMENLDEDTRLSHRCMSYGRSQWDADVVYRYEGLDSSCFHRVQVTYVTNHRMKGSQVLMANGRYVHGDLQLPEGKPVSISFNISPQEIPEGKLELVFKRGSNGRGPLVSEIRVLKVSEIERK